MSNPQFLFRRLPMRTFLAILHLFLYITSVRAAVPPGFNVQGRLTDGNGINRDGGPFSLQFRIFDAPTGGGILWTKIFPSITIRNGNFQAILSDISGQPALSDVFTGDARYLEVQVLSGPGIITAPEPPLVPRIQLVSVPYAVKAGAADTASRATTADNATRATTADTATRATSAAAVDNGAVLNVNQTFTGINGFSNTVKVGPQNYTSAVDANSGLYSNAWMIVASQNAVNATSVSFTGLDPKKMYRLRWRLAQTTGSARYLVKFNNDSRPRYRWTTSMVNTNNSASFPNSANGDSSCTLDGNFSLTFSGTPPDMHRGHLDFETNPASNSEVMGNGATAHMNGNPFLNVNTIGCFYEGDAPMSQVSFLQTGSGGFTGYFYLEQLNSPNP